jgi:branched-chain amino acid aminotransferase
MDDDCALARGPPDPPCVGMKAYKPEGGEPALFRPDMNMARMNRSAARIGLPVRRLQQALRCASASLLTTTRLLLQTFDDEALISLIMSLVKTDERFIPPPPYSCVAPSSALLAALTDARATTCAFFQRLYIRPTMIGTRPALGVGGQSFDLFACL